MSTLNTLAEKAEALTDHPLTLDYRGVARLLGVSVKSVERRRHEIPGYTRLGRRSLFIRSEVLQWVIAGCPTGANPKSVVTPAA